MTDKAALLPEGRGVALPIVYRLAARLAQIAPEELLRDPGTLRTVLLQAQQQMGYRWLVVHWQLDLETAALAAAVEADGALAPDTGMDEPRLGVVLEATRRLAAELPDCAVVSVVPGPLAVLGAIDLPEDDDAAVDACYDASDWLVAHVKRFLSAGAKAVLVNEFTPPARVLALPGDVLADAFTPVWNSIAYYDAVGVLRAPADLELPEAAVGGADVRVGATTPFASCAEVPLEWFTGSVSALPQPSPVDVARRLWVSAGEMPPEVSPGRVAEFVEAVQGR